MGLWLASLLAALHKPLTGDKTQCGGEWPGITLDQKQGGNQNHFTMGFGTLTFPQKIHGVTQHPTDTQISLKRKRGEEGNEKVQWGRWHFEKDLQIEKRMVVLGRRMRRDSLKSSKQLISTVKVKVILACMWGCFFSCLLTLVNIFWRKLVWVIYLQQQWFPAREKVFATSEWCWCLSLAMF